MSKGEIVLRRRLTFFHSVHLQIGLVCLKNLITDAMFNVDVYVDVDVGQYRMAAMFPVDGEILFSSVNFRYRPDLPLVLQDITVQIVCGSKVTFDVVCPKSLYL